MQFDCVIINCMIAKLNLLWDGPIKCLNQLLLRLVLLDRQLSGRLTCAEFLRLGYICYLLKARIDFELLNDLHKRGLNLLLLALFLHKQGLNWGEPSPHILNVKLQFLNFLVFIVEGFLQAHIFTLQLLILKLELRDALFELFLLCKRLGGLVES